MAKYRRRRQRKALKNTHPDALKLMSAFQVEDEVEIIHDAAIAASGENFGKLVPILYLNTADRPDIERLIDAHRQLGTGDVRSLWGISEDFSSYAALAMQFERPVETRILLTFPLPKWSLGVDLMVQNRCVFLQASKPGQITLDDPKGRLSVDLHIGKFAEEWEIARRKSSTERFLSEGLNRLQAKEATEKLLRQNRKFGDIRMSD